MAATVDRLKDKQASLFLPYDEPPFSGAQDARAKAGIKAISKHDFESATPCDGSGYHYHWYKAQVDSHYCLRLRNGSEFAKIKVLSNDKDSVTVAWK